MASCCSASLIMFLACSWLTFSVLGAEIKVPSVLVREHTEQFFAVCHSQSVSQLWNIDVLGECVVRACVRARVFVQAISGFLQSS